MQPNCYHDASSNRIKNKMTWPNTRPTKMNLLRLGVITGNVKGIEQLLGNVDVNINTPDKFGDTLLHRAASTGRVEVVQLFLNQGANPKIKGSFSYTPLKNAIDGNYIRVVRVLCDHGADMDSVDQFQQTALHHAASLGHIEIVRFLLDQNVKREVRDRFGQTPLYKAVEEKHIAVIKLLLQYGADIEAKDDTGQTALHHAAEKNYVAIVRLLLSWQADCKVIEGPAGYTPLHLAARNGHVESAQLLIQYGADLEAGSKNGPPVKLAIGYNHPEIAKLFWEKGADINPNVYDDDEFLLKRIVSQCPLFAVYCLTHYTTSFEVTPDVITALLDQSITHYTKLKRLDDNESAHSKTKFTLLMDSPVLNAKIIKLFFPKKANINAQVTFNDLSEPEKIIIDYCIHTDRKQWLIPFFAIKMLYHAPFYAMLGLPAEIIHMIEQLAFSPNAIFKTTLLYPIYDIEHLEVAHRQLVDFVYNFSEEKKVKLRAIADDIQVQYDQKLKLFNESNDAVTYRSISP